MTLGEANVRLVQAANLIYEVESQFEYDSSIRNAGHKARCELANFQNRIKDECEPTFIGQPKVIK